MRTVIETGVWYSRHLFVGSRYRCGGAVWCCILSIILIGSGLLPTTSTPVRWPVGLLTLNLQLQSLRHYAILTLASYSSKLLGFLIPCQIGLIRTIYLSRKKFIISCRDKKTKNDNFLSGSVSTTNMSRCTYWFSGVGNPNNGKISQSPIPVDVWTLQL